MDTIAGIAAVAGMIVWFIFQLCIGLGMLWLGFSVFMAIVHAIF